MDGSSTNDGRLRVASLQPNCGCMSLKNASGKKVWLESSFYGIARGSLIMDPGQITRVLFDWGGRDNSDYYEMAAFGVNEAGAPLRDRQPTLRIQDALVEYAPMVDTPCSDKTCEFGPLSMNRMLEATETQERESPRRGVNFSSVIEASAPLDECGCMMLRNFSNGTVTLRSTLHGAETGQIDLRAGSTVPVPFDWAGPLDTDVYVLEAVDVRPANEPSPRPGAAPGTPAAASRSAMTIRLKDYHRDLRQPRRHDVPRVLRRVRERPPLERCPPADRQVRVASERHAGTRDARGVRPADEEPAVENCRPPGAVPLPAPPQVSQAKK